MDGVSASYRTQAIRQVISREKHRAAYVAGDTIYRNKEKPRCCVESET